MSDELDVLFTPLKLRNITDEVERLRRYIEGMEDESGPQGNKPNDDDNGGGPDDKKKPKK